MDGVLGAEPCEVVLPAVFPKKVRVQRVDVLDGEVRCGRNIRADLRHLLFGPTYGKGVSPILLYADITHQ